MAKLILLRGNSGSGKTTVSKMLQRAFGHNTLLLSQDVIRRDMLYTRDSLGNQTVSLLTHLLEYGKAHCEITILEGILDAQFYRPLFERAVALYGSHIYAYYYDLPFEETLLRHGTKPNHLEFGENEMRQWFKEKDFLPMIHEHVFSKDISAEQAVRFILDSIPRS